MCTEDPENQTGVCFTCDVNDRPSFKSREDWFNFRYNWDSHGICGTCPILHKDHSIVSRNNVSYNFILI